MAGDYAPPWGETLYSLPPIPEFRRDVRGRDDLHAGTARRRWRAKTRPSAVLLDDFAFHAADPDAEMPQDEYLNDFASGGMPPESAWSTR